MRRWPHSLAARILAAVFAAVALAVAITGTYSIVEERRALDRIFLKQGNTIARSLAAFSIEQLVAQDYPALEHALETIARNDDTIDLIEVSRDGRVVAHYGIEEQPGREFVAPIALHSPREELLGQVRLVMSPRDNDAVVSLHLRDQALYLILLFAVLAVSLTWILNQLVIHPIARLTSETERVINDVRPAQAEAGDAPLPPENEIEQLTRRFREMLDRWHEKDAERSVAEKELAQYQDNLEALVEQRTKELWTARESALRSARIKSEFLTNMSHEIRTPLNGVLGLAQIGHRNSAADTDSENHETFARILDSGNLLLGILNDILDLSRLEAGKLRIDFQPASPRRCMDNAVDLLRQRAEEKGIHLVVECPRDFPAGCLIDPLRLEQVLMNLLANAIKFTEHGQVVLRASASFDELLFQVCDTGVGIAPENLSRIFTPFEQADSSTTRRFGGSGLGLTITRQLVELMGGHISVCSIPGQGSDFSVILPYRPADAPRASLDHLPAIPPTDRLAGRRILVAEDNAINQLVIERMLQAEGASVTLVANGRDAVTQATAREEEAFDLILMDIQMPEMNGYEATRRILQANPAQLIVGLTAHAFDEDREQCLLAGMAGQLTKPIEAEHLAQVLAQHLLTPLQSRLPFPEAPPPGAADDDYPGKINWQALEGQFGKDTGMVPQLQKAFVATCQDWPSRVHKALAAGDLADIARLAHEIRGATGFLKAYDLMDSARATEIAARDGKAIAMDLARCLATDIEELVGEARDILAAASQATAA